MFSDAFFFLLPIADIGFTGKASELGFGPCEKSHLGNSSSESQSPRLSGSSNGAVGISESSTVTIQEFECKNNSIDKAVTHEFHGGFRRKKRRRTPVEGNVYPASINLQNLELDNDEKTLVKEIVSGENEKLSVEATKLGAFCKEKRLRKPTLRYIEEFSGKKSKDSNERENCSALTATQDRSKVRCQNEHHHMSPGILSSVPEEDSISENQTLAEFRTQRKLAKKHASILVGKVSTLHIFIPSTFKLFRRKLPFFFSRLSSCMVVSLSMFALIYLISSTSLINSEI